MGASRTLRELTGMGYTPPIVRQSALVLIDCQNEGVMQLDGVEPALVECPKRCFRDSAYFGS